jgi:leader peptidase (prepilin peptidase)/N-methyltransferase
MGGIWMLGCATVVGWAVTLCVVDIRRRRLPNALTLPGAAVILAGATAAGAGMPAILGGLALSGLYLLVHLADPAGMGAGDVKLALSLGALTGAYGIPVWVLGALGAPMLTAVIGGVAMLRHRGSRVPHGPSMCLASLAAVGLAVF